MRSSHAFWQVPLACISSPLLLIVILGLLAGSATGQETSVRPGVNDRFRQPNVDEFVERFEREGRDVFDHREEIVEACGLKPGMVVADIGAGTGLFTRRFAEKIGAEGKVFAVDISERFVRHVEQAARQQGLKNVTGVLSGDDTARLPMNSIDLAFICDTYHHFEFPHKTMSSIHRALRPGGHVILVDFERIEGVSSDFILGHVRAGKEVFVREIEAAGFRQVGSEDFLKESYFLRFEKITNETTPRFSPAQVEANGVRIHSVQSPRQAGETEIRVLLPDPLKEGHRYPVVYLLPVEAGRENRYGDGMAEAVKEDLANRHQVICVAPTFSQLPWYADHPTDPHLKQEAYFLNEVVPFMEENYPVIVGSKGRWLVGFSKSGWGAWSMLLRHPQQFAMAGAWDAPLMLAHPDKFGTGPIFGSQENFDAYQITSLLKQKAGALHPETRLVLTGIGSFESDHIAAHKLLDELQIPHIYRDGPKRAHRWDTGWLPELVALIADETKVRESRSIKIDDALRARCLAILREGLASDEFWPSIHAAEALSLAGHGDEVRKALEPKLATDQDDQHRCGLSRELVRAGDLPKARIMLDILAGEDPHGHIHACESLFKVPADIGDGKSLRLAFGQTDNHILRLMAAAALGRRGNPAAMAAIREQLKNPKPEVNRIAAWLLARLGNKEDISGLRVGLAAAPDALTRCYFEHALATLGDPAGLKALTNNLGHEEPGVRVFAATFSGDARATAVTPQLTKLLDDAVLDVRIRAAQSLLVLSQPPPPERHEDVSRDVYPATDKNPRYSEGSVLRMQDGTLLYATTEFIGGGEDAATARIIGRTSSDGGRTWSEPQLLQETTGKQNVMSVTLRHIPNRKAGRTEIGMFYLIKNSSTDLQVAVRFSTEERLEFGPPIKVSDRPGYHVVNNDRVTQLSSGRLLVPVASSPNLVGGGHFKSSCFISDDDGRSWRSSKEQVDLENRGAMEPEVLELNEGKVLMILRTQMGIISASRSDDGGDTWSAAESWNVLAPEAPATLRRIPSTGDLLLIWNNAGEIPAGSRGKRTPLTAAVSTDEGKTWSFQRNLETDPNETYAYTSLLFADDRAVLSYYVGDNKTGKISSRFRSLPVSWFYEQAAE